MADKGVQKYMENNYPIISLKNIVRQAIDAFNVQEKYLIEHDLSERCMCARFAMHLSEALRGTPYHEYIADVEYNRGADGRERAIKRIDDAPITVDLIVHKRGSTCNYGLDNLLCIEMKKSKNRCGCNDDENRLRKMTNSDYGFHYKLGVMLIIDHRLKSLRIKSEFAAGRQISEMEANDA